jgi:hypothetical protein
VKEDLLFFGFVKPVKRFAEEGFALPSDKSPARHASIMTAGGDGSTVSKPEGFRVSKVVDLSR